MGKKEGPAFKYVGKVGTGFSNEVSSQLRKQLGEMHVLKPTLTERLRKPDTSGSSLRSKPESHIVELQKRANSVNRRSRGLLMAKKKAAKKAKKAKKRSAKRELIDTGTDKRYVRRGAKGRFKESDDVGRSLTADRRRKAKKKVKSGHGDKGDR